MFVVVRVVPAYLGQPTAEAFANISPLAALALCGGMMFPTRIAFILTFGTFITSDIILNLKYEQPIINYYSLFLLVLFAVIFTGGYLLRKHRRINVLLGCTIASSLLFYLLLNSVSFFMDPHYTKIWQGGFKQIQRASQAIPPLGYLASGHWLAIQYLHSSFTLP